MYTAGKDVDDPQEGAAGDRACAGLRAVDAHDPDAEGALAERLRPDGLGDEVVAEDEAHDDEPVEGAEPGRVRRVGGRRRCR